MARNFAGSGTGNASSAYLSCADRARFDTVHGTIACTFKTSQSSTGNMMRRDYGSPNRNWLLRMTGGNVQFLVIYGGNPSVSSLATKNDGSWHWCVATWTWNGSNTTIELWIDGVSQGTATASASSPSLAEPIILGAFYNAGVEAENYNGDLAECAMWDAKLGSGDIAAYCAGVAPSLLQPASLVMYAPLVREKVDVVGAAPVDGGGVATTVATHPRVIYPRRRSTSRGTSSAPATGQPIRKRMGGMVGNPFRARGVW